MSEATSPSQAINLPNALSVVRIIAAIIVPVAILVYDDSVTTHVVAGIAFTFGAITDWADGRLARSWNLITTFGKIVDPIADKLLVLGAFATFAARDVFPWWILIPIIIREVTITILRLYWLNQGVAVAAVKSGKQKTALQIIAIAFVYLSFIYREDIAQQADRVFGVAQADTTVGVILTVCMLVSLLLALAWTLWSGFVFFRNNWHLFRSPAA